MYFCYLTKVLNMKNIFSIVVIFIFSFYFSYFFAQDTIICANLKVLTGHIIQEDSTKIILIKKYQNEEIKQVLYL